MSAEAQTSNDANTVDDIAAAAEAQATAKRETRERSRVDFPYLNLEEAEEGAKQLFGAAGTVDVSQAQAADAMKQSVVSSTFRVRLSAMRLFGLIEAENGRVRLTPLGRAIAEPGAALEARVDAFLNVPLYKLVQSNHDGRTLPGAKALEMEFINHGVAVKQSERARQVFDRSARHAGFIKAGSDRFSTPIIQAKRQDPQPAEPRAAHTPSPERGDPLVGSSNGGGGDGMDPVIAALVKKLPLPGAPWSGDDQVIWLRMMAMAFTMAYGGKRPITIKLEDDSPTRP